MLASEFIAAVRAQAKVPADIADASILLFGDREIAGRMVPAIRQSHQEFMVAEATVDSYNGKVAIPQRAVAASVRHVQRVDAGLATHLPHLELEDDRLEGSSAGPAGWYFDGGCVVLLPRGSSGTVRFRYFLRPSKLVVETDTSSVRSITSAAKASGGWVLTLSGSAPSGSSFDVVSSGPAHECVAIDLASASTIPQASCLSVFSSLTSCGYVTKPGLTPYVPLPEELAASCVHLVAAVILRSLGYDSEASAQSAIADSAMDAWRSGLAPRSEGNPRKLRGGIRRALSWGWGV